MNSFTTLFFPETNIFKEHFYPLFLFCTPLHYLQPVEPGLESDMYNESNFFLENGLCEAHTSVAPGENSDRFLNLLSTLIKPGDLHVSPTNSPTKNIISGKGVSNLSSLLGEYSFEHISTEAEMDLWRARLLLAIADIYDSQEEALREEVDLLSEDEISAFHSLPESNGLNGKSIYSEVEDIVQLLEKSQDVNTNKRFDAWLYLLREQSLPPIKLWVASSRDSGDFIFRRYTAAGNGSAVPLLKLALPAYIAASGKYVVKQIEEFHQATNQIHRGLVADFKRITTTNPYLRGSKESLLPFGTDWAKQWEYAIDHHFPPSSNGRKSITFYLLPDQPIAELVCPQKIFTAARNQYTHGLLGILE